MTWPEICEELVKRWPEKFYLYPKLALMYGEERASRMESDGVMELMSKSSEMENMPDDLTSIHDICTAIGAVVWSYPSWDEDVESGVESGLRGWCGGWDDWRDALTIKTVYPTRAEAELAALGAWLEATR